jgi:peptidoglycan/xylan/chitin deacetylase (PgdA/CDA1 family)
MQLAPLFPLLHPLLASAFPKALWTGDCQRPEIALTFDDGPHPQYTPALLEVLQHYQIPASFFWLGACVQRSPAVARSVFEQGHWLGLHGFDHRSFPTLSTPELKTSLERTQQVIAQACGLPPQRVRDVRPPNGLFTPQILKQLTQWNYRPVMWSVVPEDWVCPGVSVVVRRVLQQTRNGSIIVLHDGSCGGQAIVETVAQIIPALLARQYQFVTLDRFWLPSSGS